MLAALAGGMFALAGQAAEAERWADAADRQPDREAARSEDPAAGAWAALLRAMLCRGGAGQMRADANQAASLFAAAGTAAPPVATIMQGLTRVLSGDLDGGDTILADAVSAARDVNSRDAFIVALCERALVATARSEWPRAETLAGQAHTVLDQAGLEETFVAPWPAPFTPAPPCTAATSRRHARTSPAPSGRGIS